MRLSGYILVLVLIFVSSCGEVTLPKPKAMLRLDYPEAKRVIINTPNFLFERNTLSEVKEEKNSVTLDYPLLRAAIYITYKPVNNDLKALLSDAQKLSYEHVVKADNITEQPFVNNDDAVYGMFYEVRGDAASQAQFYVTDSTRHFVTGSLYFYAKPNYDSIYPAAVYLQKDIRRIMETIEWQ